MLNDSSDELPTLDDRLHLFWYCLLHKDPFFLSFDWETNVDGTGLGSHDLDVERVFREVNLTTVRTIDQDGRNLAEDLNNEGCRRGDGEGRDGRVDQEGRLGAIHCHNLRVNE